MKFKFLGSSGQKFKLGEAVNLGVCQITPYLRKYKYLVKEIIDEILVFGQVFE